MTEERELESITQVRRLYTEQLEIRGARLLELEGAMSEVRKAVTGEIPIGECRVRNSDATMILDEVLHLRARATAWRLKAEEILDAHRGEQDLRGLYEQTLNELDLMIREGLDHSPKDLRDKIHEVLVQTMIVRTQ